MSSPHVKILCARKVEMNKVSYWEHKLDATVQNFLPTATWRNGLCIPETSVPENPAVAICMSKMSTWHCGTCLLKYRSLYLCSDLYEILGLCRTSRNTVRPARRLAKADVGFVYNFGTCMPQYTAPYPSRHKFIYYSNTETNSVKICCLVLPDNTKRICLFEGAQHLFFCPSCQCQGEEVVVAQSIKQVPSVPESKNRQELRTQFLTTRRILIQTSASG
jgi:hypothetical protein